MEEPPQQKLWAFPQWSRIALGTTLLCSFPRALWGLSNSMGTWGCSGPAALKSFFTFHRPPWLVQKITLLLNTVVDCRSWRVFSWILMSSSGCYINAWFLHTYNGKVILTAQDKALPQPEILNRSLQPSSCSRYYPSVFFLFCFVIRWCPSLRLSSIIDRFNQF